MRKSPLPPDQTWTEVPFYTYLIGENKEIFYTAMREDRPVSLEAIKSFPVANLINFPAGVVEIEPDEAVFIDWEGNYFIGKESDIERPLDRIVIYSTFASCSTY